MDRLEDSCSIGGIVKCYRQFGKQSGILKILSIEVPCDLELKLLGIYPGEIRTYVHPETYILMFTAR